MNHKQMPRLGSAIASTILSLFSAVSLVGVDQAQAAVFTYNFDAGQAISGFFKVDDSSLTGIGYQEIAVSEGRADTLAYSSLNLSFGDERAKEHYYNLAEGARAVFYQGVFRGLSARGGYSEGKYFNPGPFSFYYSGSASWSIDTPRQSTDMMWISFLSVSKEAYVSKDNTGSGSLKAENTYGYRGNIPVNYTLVKTETVPEPLTAGGTALALAGLSWLKHKKKMAA
jgi:hypothetical protein